jgi:acetolactate synthase-1/2/3 large subunit
MQVSEYIAKFLVDHGVEDVFMLSGGAAMHLVDAFGRQPGLNYVCCLHEQAASFAAQAYGEYKSSPGAVLVTAGPGGTNTITGLAAAWLDSTPCVFVSGQAKRADLMIGRGVRSMGPQEVDILGIVRPLTKYAVTLLDPARVRYELEKAWHEATTGRRGPVWLDVPLDVQAVEVDATQLAGYVPEVVASKENLLDDQVAKTIALLKTSERPVLFLGGGARTAFNAGLVEAVVEALHVPTLLTWKAMDMLEEEHACFCGRPGSIASRGSNFTQQNADWMLVVGARLDRPQVAFSHQNFARGARKIVVDIDAHEIAKLDMPIDVAVEADATDFLRELLRQLRQTTLPDHSPWLRTSKQWLAEYPMITPEFWAQTGTVNSYVLMDVLSDACMPEDLLAPGSSGACSDIFLQCFRLKRGQRVVNSPSLGAMGTGLPGTIGSCIASGGRRTICVNGDGGFQLNIQDLETVRRLGLPIKFFILENGVYGSIVAMQKNHFKGRMVASDPSSHLTLPDIRKVAAAYGVQSFEIQDHSRIREQVAEVLASEGPAICAVHIDIDQPTLPRATSKRLPDGSIVSLPMEDMAPPLPREEFLAHMIVPPLEP